MARHIMQVRTSRLTLSTALTLVQAPESFLATYHAVKDGAAPDMDWLRKDGGKVFLKRSETGRSVRLIAYSYP